MIRPVSPPPLASFRRKRLPGDRPTPPPPPEVTSPYGTAFWFTYLANTAIMVAMSLMFRYADFVEFLGGSEFELGLIVGVGMVGSLLMRLVQGVGIDRHGTRLVWLWSLALFVVALIAHAWPTTVHGPAVYVLQVIFRTAVAGAFGASITFISLSANAARMAEAIGMIGTSGFLAMAVGPILGDLLLGNAPNDRGTINLMFFTAAGLGVISFVAAVLATRGQQPPPLRRQPPLWAVLCRYHPGRMLLMGVTMGVGAGLPGTFVRPFASHIGVERIAWFFSTYAVCAFIARMLTRRICEQWGVRPTVLLGMAFMILGMAAFAIVSGAWHFAIPGLLLGVSHALLFPAIVAGGSGAFPERYRGLGTAVILAMMDFGTLVGAPLAGAIVSLAGAMGLPGFTMMFLSIAALLLLGTLWYAWSPNELKSASEDRTTKRRRHARRSRVA